LTEFLFYSESHHAMNADQNGSTRAPVEASNRGFVPLLWIVVAIVCAFVGPIALVLWPDFLIVLLPWAIAALLTTFFAIGAFIARKWRWGIAAATLPISLAAVLSNFGGIWWFMMRASEDIRFHFARSSYEDHVNQLPADHGPKLAVFVLWEDGWLD
jgi:hypothetical protein